MNSWQAAYGGSGIDELSMAFVTGEDIKIEKQTKGWKFAVGSGILGWVLDAFDFFVVVFLFDTLAEHFHVSKASVVYTLTLTLAMRPLGAVFFGALVVLEFQVLSDSLAVRHHPARAIRVSLLVFVDE